ATDCKVSKVTRVIRKAVAGATFQKEIQTELFYLMPEKQVSRFVALFKDLEARKEELGILSFGANGTTMEDVFLRDPTGPAAASRKQQVPALLGMNVLGKRKSFPSSLQSALQEAKERQRCVRGRARTAKIFLPAIMVMSPRTKMRRYRKRMSETQRAAARERNRLQQAECRKKWSPARRRAV
ncbi:hypothetical protein BaRGS_00017745, partial [Batillaria attramentaria]